MHIHDYNCMELLLLFLLFSSMKEPVHSLHQAHVPGDDDDDDDDVETDGNNRKTHYHGNIKKPGYIVYSYSEYKDTVDYSYTQQKLHKRKLSRFFRTFDKS